MSTVELIYDKDCPNVSQARENLLRAFDQSGLSPLWREWERTDKHAPEYVRVWGSPTVLVNGKDVAGLDATDAASCRIYTNGQGSRQGVPPVSLIAAAFTKKTETTNFKQGTIPLLPAIGTALLPKLVCPACWPAYSGLLSALGLGFINYSPYLLPLTVLFLVAVIATLIWRAGTRRGYAPFVLGIAAAAILLAGKFLFDSEIATYTGVALLVGASAWNSWPRRKQAAICPKCHPEASNTVVIT